MPNKTIVYAVILVGGRGVRLKPISTESRPKAFLPITKDDRTMFRMTLGRIGRIVPLNNVIVVANKMHAALVKKDFPAIRRENLLLEPLSRNTASAIALAATVLGKRDPDAIMIVLPADHYITGEEKYLETIECAVETVRAHPGCLVVMGLEPKYPATGFGYIRLKDGPGSAVGKNTYALERFVEKPDLDTAKRYVKSGRYLWNSGIFIFSASYLLTVMAKYAPEVTDGFKALKRKGLRAVYEDLPNISIDSAIMEKARPIYCVKSSFGWQDLGSPQALIEILEKELAGFSQAARSGKYPKNPPVSWHILEKLKGLG